MKETPGWEAPRRIVVPSGLMPARLAELKRVAPEVEFIPVKTAEEAARAARRVIYLDRSLSVAHLTLGSILYRRRDFVGARRAYRNAHDLCAGRPPDELIPFSDGELAGRLAEVAAGRLAVLEAATELSS